MNEPADVAFADLVVAACASAGKQIQPPMGFFENPSQHRKMSEYLKREITSAKRYILDDDVTEAAVDLGMQHPEIVLAVLKNAMAPFDSMWIEWSPNAQLRATMSNTGIPEGHYASGGPSPSKTGILLKRVSDTRYRISMVGEALLETRSLSHEGGFSAPQYGAAPLAIEYDVQAPLYGGVLNPAEQIVVRFTNWTPTLLRTALLAGAYLAPVSMEEDDDDEELSESERLKRKSERLQMRFRQCEALASHAQWTFDPVFGKPFRERVLGGDDPLSKTSTKTYYHQHAVDTLQFQIQEEAGIFRFVISVIALMIGRDRIASETTLPRQKKSRMVKGKIIPFLENRRVSLTVPRKIANKRLLRALKHSLPRAQHDVEGHWKQRRKGYDVDCDHVMVWETPKREVCAIHGCGFKRWRVDDFTRGDPTIGTLNKTRIARLDRKVAPLPSVAAQVYGD